MNIVNAGNKNITIKLNNEEIEKIYTFDYIVNDFININIVNDRCTPTVKKWFMSNFKKWLKAGAPKLTNEFGTNFIEQIYVSMEDYVSDLVEYESSEYMSDNQLRQIIISQFPHYAKNDNIQDNIIFCGGRLFRLYKFLEPIQELYDFLLAVDADKKEHNETSMPSVFLFNSFDRLHVMDAIKRSKMWHRYVKNMNDKITKLEAEELIDSQTNSDIEVIANLAGGAKVVKLLNNKAAIIEGKIMKHCIASYGDAIKQGKTIIYSVRDKEGFPQATLEINATNNNINQIKGQYNQQVNEHFHKSIIQFITENNYTITNDRDKIGLV